MSSKSELLLRTLARAMLASDDDHKAMVERCAAALSSRPKGLAGWVRKVRAMLGGERPPGAEEAVVALLGQVATARGWLVDEAPSVMVRRVPLLEAPFEPRVGAFRRAPMPPLTTVGELAALLGVSSERLEAIEGPMLSWRDDGRPSPYAIRLIAKASGGVRLVEAPSSELRALQRALLDRVLAHATPHDACHGFREGRSPRTHASLHVGRAVVLRVDLSDFFMTISRARVRGLFVAMGYPDRVASCMAALTTHATPRRALSGLDGALRHRTMQRARVPHLPQGAPTSPALANLCAYRLDVRLSALAGREGATYSRYADDLTFSGDEGLLRRARQFVHLVAQICRDEGFPVRADKTRVMPRSQRQQVTGVVVNERVNVARADHDRLKAQIVNCLRHGPSTQNRDGVPDLRAHLEGRVAHVRSLSPRRAEKLERLLGAVDWAR